MKTWVLAALLAWTSAASAIAQERGPETLAPETLVPESRAWDMERAFEEVERLQAEVALLRRLGEAQAALLAWNRERADSAAGSAVLSGRLCTEPALAAWCRALPATFGADAAEAAKAADDGQGRDRER